MTSLLRPKPFQVPRDRRGEHELSFTSPSAWTPFASITAQAESVNHPAALYHFNSGNQFGGDPAIGARVAYGPGPVDENLPAFIVLPEVNYPQGGTTNWSYGFLPAHDQGAPQRSVGSPILDLNPPGDATREGDARLRSGVLQIPGIRTTLWSVTQTSLVIIGGWFGVPVV